jgi:hypothetical protein
MAELKKISLDGWLLEANTGTEGAPVWTPVKGMRTMNMVIDPTTQDTTTYDSDGWGSDMTTLRKWRIDGEGLEGFTGAFVMDPGQVALKARGQLIGYDAEIGIRFSRTGPDEGYQGVAAVDWSGTGGPITEVTRFNFTLKGQGQLTTFDPTP